MKVYVEGSDDSVEEKENALPDVKKGDQFFSKDIEPKQHFTQPPPRYTEARLVKTSRGTGNRPSVYICAYLGYDPKTGLCYLG